MLGAAKPAVRWGLWHALPRTALRRFARDGDIQARLVMETAGTRPAELHALLDQVRATGDRVVHGRFASMTVDHAAVRQILASDDFTSSFPAPPNPVVRKLADWSLFPYVHPIQPPSLLAVDPPDHTRYRKLVTRVFTNRAVARLRDRTEQIAASLLDELDAAQPVDLVAAYCAQLPVTVICEILGVPAADTDLILSYGAAAAPSLDIGLRWGTFREVEHGLREFDRWLDSHIARLRANPQDDLLSELVTAREDGVGLTDLELKSTAGLVLAAGFETTVNLLGNGIALLADHPAERARLTADPSLWPNAVDEVLRFDPPVLLTGRAALRGVPIADTTVRAGRVVTGVVAGANRDPAVFTDPDTFDVARPNAREHLSFGHGRHHCLGASLARMEGEVGLRAIFDRFPDLRLLDGATRRPTRILRGYEKLPALLG
ncbi:cytochrome P450 [Nocardioides montaniterrae]